MNKCAKDIQSNIIRTPPTKFQEPKVDLAAVLCVHHRYLGIIFDLGTHRDFIEAAQFVALQSHFSTL